MKKKQEITFVAIIKILLYTLLTHIITIIVKMIVTEELKQI